ncbi:hypothetical protein JKP88DRAFT_266198 [Tribonema minus]|uniref:Peptidase M16 N-terminal domain-containing protein n=1 Tax=Tribonema minus TaxID=303371 RepID=A0A835ZEV6_9STRA|nr:hypothetical protein JKP88DRAFT_266198 [Tribonema minus]
MQTLSAGCCGGGDVREHLEMRFGCAVEHCCALQCNMYVARFRVHVVQTLSAGGCAARRWRQIAFATMLKRQLSGELLTLHEGQFHKHEKEELEVPADVAAALEIAAALDGEEDAAVLEKEEFEASKVEFTMEQEIPFDTRVVTGELENGMKYYVLHNPEPQNRVELSVAIKSGSIHEANNERGVAHMVEHLGFRSSEGMEGEFEIIKQLEALGIKFGPHQNAYTSFDRTVYQLQVPLDDMDMLKQGMRALCQLSLQMRLSDKDVDRERSVVVEEWRQSLSADTRSCECLCQSIYKGSIVPDRMPIGVMDVIENVSPDTVRGFYRRSYHPELTAVVAVGAFTCELAEVELSDTTVSVCVRQPQVVQPSTVADYRKFMVLHLFHTALSERLSKIAQRNTPPFIAASSCLEAPLTGMHVFTLSVSCQEGREAQGLSAVLTEIEHIKRSGLKERGVANAKLQRSVLTSATVTLNVEAFQNLYFCCAQRTGLKEREVANAKRNAAKWWQHYLLSHAKRESAAACSELVDHFLSAATVVPPDWETGMALEVLERIASDETGMAVEVLEGIEPYEVSAAVAAYHWGKGTVVHINRPAALKGGLRQGAERMAAAVKRMLSRADAAPLDSLQGARAIELNVKVRIADNVNSGLITEEGVAALLAAHRNDDPETRPNHNALYTAVSHRANTTSFNHQRASRRRRLTSNADCRHCKRRANHRGRRRSAARRDKHNDHDCLYGGLNHDQTHVTLHCAAVSADALPLQIADIVNGGPITEEGVAALLAAHRDDDPETAPVRALLRQWSSGALSAGAPSDFADLLPIDLEAGSIVKRAHYAGPEDRLDCHELVLSNGMEVVYKQTDFQDDEILFSINANGGMNEVPPEHMINAIMADAIAQQMGIFGVPPRSLLDLLAGRRITFETSVGNIYRGCSGVCLADDLETALQMIHVLFTARIEYDEERVEHVMALVREGVASQSRDPSTQFSNTLWGIITQNHPWYAPASVEMLDTVDAKHSLSIFNDMFKNPAEFRMVMCGSLDPSEAEQLFEIYLASIPVPNPPPGPILSVSEVTPLKITFPTVGEVCELHLPMVDDTASTVITLPAMVGGAANPTHQGRMQDEVLLAFACRVAQDRLTEVLRFDLGSVYSVSVSHVSPLRTHHGLVVHSLWTHNVLLGVLRFDLGSVYSVSVSRSEHGRAPPRLPEDPVQYVVTISYTCKPSEVPVLRQKILEELAKMQQEPPSDADAADEAVLKEEEVSSAITAAARDTEVDQRTNEYWIGKMLELYDSPLYGDDIAATLEEQWAVRSAVVEELSADSLRSAYTRFFGDLSSGEKANMISQSLNLRVRGLHELCQVEFTMEQPLPFDTRVVTGKLDNGMSYYVLQNPEPQNRVELNVAIKTGSIHEADNERGLAHMVEHLGFRSSEGMGGEFEIVKQLQALGIKFGPHQNAYTGIDRTVYQLQVPLDDMDMLKKGMRDLCQLSLQMRLSDDDVKRERSVVVEEWRQGLSAGLRNSECLWQSIYKGSMIPDRLPIGIMDVIENATPDTVRGYYRKNYHPELMAVVAVGAFTCELAEVELRDTTVSVFVHQPQVVTPTTVASYRNYLVLSMFHTALSERLSKIAQRNAPPFTGAQSGVCELVAGTYTCALTVSCQEGHEAQGLSSVLTEIEHIKRTGLKEREVANARRNFTKTYQHRLLSHVKRQSATACADLVDHFLDGATAAPTEWEIADIVNGGPITEEGIAALLAAQRNDDPETAPVRALLRQWSSGALSAGAPSDFADLLPIDLDAGSIVKRTHYAGPDNQLDCHELVLSNGMVVVYKQTDFKDDEILFTLNANGGYNELPPEHVVDARIAEDIAREMGVFGVPRRSMSDMLAGRRIAFYTNIHSSCRRCSGDCCADDLETTLQMIHVLFTASIEYDEERFEHFMTLTKEERASQSRDPSTQFSDKLWGIITEHHPLWSRRTMEMLDSVDAKRSLSIFDNMFKNPAEFRSLSEVTPLKVTFPSMGEVCKLHLPMVDDMASTKIAVPVTINSTARPTHRGREQDEVLLAIACRVIEDRLLEVLRFELGSVYSISVSYSEHGQSLPQRPEDPVLHVVMISYTCKPSEVPLLRQKILEELAKMQQEPVQDTKAAITGAVTDEEVTNAITAAARDREVNLRTNWYWNSTMLGLYDSPLYNGDIAAVLEEWWSVRNATTSDLNADSLRTAYIRLFGDLSRAVCVSMVPRTLWRNVGRWLAIAAVVSSAAFAVSRSSQNAMR